MAGPEQDPKYRSNPSQLRVLRATSALVSIPRREQDTRQSTKKDRPSIPLVSAGLWPPSRKPASSRRRRADIVEAADRAGSAKRRGEPRPQEVHPNRSGPASS